MNSGSVAISGGTKRFGDVVAVDDITFEVDGGQFLTLLGPSGCGKTTTLRMIAGFETPTEGTVYLSGEDITDLPPYDRSTSMVFQNYALFPHKTVGENVGFGLKMDGVDEQTREERVAEILELVELGGYESRAIDELSGGQQQRVALARALVVEPDVLLLDEPLGALDLKLRKQMQIELKRIQEELEITFVYVTHDQEEALTMSDEIILLNEGQIEQQGSPTEIYEQPASRFVADFIGNTNLLVGSYVPETAAGSPAISLNGVELPVASQPDVSGGDDISLSIRPEKIELNDENATTLDGTVEDVIYQGNIAHLHVDVGGTTLVVERQIQDSVNLPERDAQCTVSWNPEYQHVLTE